MSSNKELSPYYRMKFDMNDDWERRVREAIHLSERSVANLAILRLLQTVLPRDASPEEMKKGLKNILLWGADFNQGKSTTDTQSTSQKGHELIEPFSMDTQKVKMDGVESSKGQEPIDNLSSL